MDNGFCSYNRFLDGDTNAFGAVVSEYGNRLLYYINTYVKNITASEDIMEDVFAELICRKKRFDTESMFKAYIFKAARNKALNYIKKNARYTSDELPEELSEEHFIPEEHILKEEKKKLLSTCIAELKDEYRDVVYLIYYEDMSYEQAAKIMKKNKKQIDNLVSRAKSTLKAKLAKSGISQLSDL